MESQAKYLFVGSVVIALVAFTVVAVLWLSEARSYRNAEYYDIYFREHTLYGLQMNSDVTMRGIKVGSVMGLSISKENVENVLVRIAVQGGTPVKTDTEAQLNRNLLTGFASIDLRKGTQNAGRLVAVLPGQTYPVIPEGKTELEQVADSLPEVVNHIGEITQRVRLLFSEENLQSTSKIIKNVEKISDSLAASSTDIEQLITKVSTMSEKIEKTSDSIRNFTAKGTERLDGLSSELTQGLQELKGVIQQLNGKSNELVQSIVRSADVVAGELRTISQSVQVATSAASSTLESYEQPARILAGPNERALGPGERVRNGK